MYVHTDGHPEGEAGRLADLERFFEAVEKQNAERRYSDAEYLAAKYVVYKALEYSRYSPRVYALNRDAALADGRSAYEPPYVAGGEPRPLDFLSVGVTKGPEQHGDLEFEYLVNCDEEDDNGRPAVYWRPVSLFREYDWRQGAPVTT